MTFKTLKFPRAYQFFLLATLLMSSLTVQASDFYDCQSALSSLNEVVKIGKNNLEPLDLKKQLADIVVLKTPLLMTTAVFDIFRASKVKATSMFTEYGSQCSEWYLDRPLRYEEDKDGKKQIRFYTAGSSTDGPLSVAEAEDKIWEDILHLYRINLSKPSIRTDLENEVEYAAKLGISHEQYQSNRQILITTSQDPKLLLMMRQLLNDSFFYIYRFKVKTNSGSVPLADRKNFVKWVSGSSVSESVEDKAERVQRVVPDSINVDNLSGPEITLSQTRNQQTSSHTHSLLSLLTEEYPILWKTPFFSAFTSVLNFVSEKPKEQLAYLNRLSENERTDVARNIWDYLKTLYRLPKGVSAEDLRKSAKYSAEVEVVAVSLNQPVEKYLQTRMIISALDANSESRERIIGIIAETLKESFQFSSFDAKKRTGPMAKLLSYFREKKRKSLLKTLNDKARLYQQDESE